MKYLIHKINLQNEFQRVIDTGWKYSFESELYEQRFILYKPFTLSGEKTDLSKRLDDYKSFIAILEDFNIVYSMLISNPIDKVYLELHETAELFKVVVFMKPPVDKLEKQTFNDVWFDDRNRKLLNPFSNFMDLNGLMSEFNRNETF